MRKKSWREKGWMNSCTSCVGAYGFVNHDKNCKPCKLRRYHIEKKRINKLFSKLGYPRTIDTFKYVDGIFQA